MIPSVSTSREMIRGRPAEWKQNHRMEKQSVEQIHRSCLTNKSFISFKNQPERLVNSITKFTVTF